MRCGLSEVTQKTKQWSWQQSDFITHVLKQFHFPPKIFLPDRNNYFLFRSIKLSSSEHHLKNSLNNRAKNLNPQYYWHFRMTSSFGGLEAVLCVASASLMLISIFGLYPLDANSTLTSPVLPVVTIKSV